MNIVEEITAALLSAKPDDLEMARRYLKWLKMRRKINHRFYFRAHWVDHQKTPGKISQASKPLLEKHQYRAHWL